MNKLAKIEDIIRENKPQLGQDYKVKKIGIFGSYRRGEAKKGSDVDILVEFREPIGLFKFMELEDYLQRKLRIKVDLVSKKALKPYIGRYILREVMYI